jgi:hypothetical protein
LGWNSILALFAWGFAGYGLAAINPNGFGMWAIPFQTVGVESLQNLIQEWASPDFHQPVQQLMLVLLFLTVGAVGLSNRRIDGTDLSLFVVFGFLAFTARRNFGPFAMVTAPILARHWVDLNTALKEKLKQEGGIMHRIFNMKDASDKKISEPVQLSVNILLLVFLLFAAIYKGISVSDPEFIHEKEREYYPANAVNWILAYRPQPNLFSTYNWGGYLTWKAREYPVFVDGRTDLFGDEIIAEYIEVETAAEGWHEILDKYKINTIMIGTDTAISKILPENGWNISYKDDSVLIFAK